MVATAIFLALFQAALFQAAQTGTGTFGPPVYSMPSSVRFPASVARYALEIDDQAAGKMVLTIDMKGKVTLGEGVTADAAAKQFWDALAKYAPLANCASEAARYRTLAAVAAHL